MSAPSVKAVLRGILVTWFLVVTISVLIPSWQMIGLLAGEVALPPPPLPPAPLATSSEAEVAAYSAQIEAYLQYIAAYKAHTETTTTALNLASYQLVVKETLGGMLGTFIAAFLAFAFANAGVGLALNYMRLRAKKDIQGIDLI